LRDKKRKELTMTKYVGIKSNEYDAFISDKKPRGINWVEATDWTIGTDTQQALDWEQKGLKIAAIIQDGSRSYPTRYNCVRICKPSETIGPRGGTSWSRGHICMWAVVADNAEMGKAVFGTEAVK
jgi:hypothetical protein